ncbi:MAG: HAD family hydrolase, partial [Sulfitobacter sp. SK025]
MDMTEIKALLFDKDGTLFDFSATWEAWAAGFLTRLSAGSDARATALGHLIGFDFRTRKFSPDSIVIAGTPAEVVQILAPQVPELSPHALLDLLNEEAELAPQLEAVPLRPLLTLLREKGLALGVATNDAEAPAQAHLAEAGITDMFDFIAGFDSGHGAKPGP